ncbi:MAG TPA: arylamine N-acetyltransferase [Gammaproteobacteria bacterium]
MERIGFTAEPKRDLETLRALHRLHPFAIPFENLSTLAGDPVSLDIDSIAEKLIRQRRGGYCFEQNTLLQTVLETLGFDVLPLAARVVWNQSTGQVNPRTHMVLLVSVADRQFLCDVGFGGATLTAPLEFSPGIIQQTPHEPFRIRQSGDEFVLEVRLGGEWRPAYEFDLQPQQPIDYEAMNHFVQTHPSSHFRYALMAGRPDSRGRHAIGGNELSRYENGELVERRRLESVDALASALRERFGIEAPSSPGLDSALESVAASTEP